jgi:flavin-dependent dehydrogenase
MHVVSTGHGADRFDIAIIGARCAGAPLAALLARLGLRVALVEQVTFPRDTLSSHIIEADGLAFLDSLGLTERLRATEAPSVDRVDMRVEDVRIETAWPRRPGDPAGLMSIRRAVLDPILAEAAGEAGADMRFGEKATGIVEDGGRVVGVRIESENRRTELRASLVVGADGRNSTIARLVGARKYNVTHNQRANYWRYYEHASIAEPTFVSHRWGKHFVLGIPTDAGLYQVLIWPELSEVGRGRGDLDGLVTDFASRCEPIASRVAPAQPVGKILGARRWECFFRDAAGPGWVLVGDAGHFKDPGPGRGISDAFFQVQMLALAIASAVDKGPAQLDAAMRRWASWRDQEFAEHYWFAADTSAAGPVPAVLPKVLRGLRDEGRTAEFFDLINHRRKPSQVISAPRILRATAGALKAQSSRRRAVVREVGTLLAEDLRRRRLNRRPVYVQPDASPRAAA